jgi:hypothetical protein
MNNELPTLFRKIRFRATSHQRRATDMPSTPIEDPLQISLFYAKQTQFPKTQMNLSYSFTTNYEQITMTNANKNKPNQTQPVVSLPARTALAAATFTDYVKKAGAKSGFFIRRNNRRSILTSCSPPAAGVALLDGPFHRLLLVFR